MTGPEHRLFRVEVTGPEHRLFRQELVDAASDAFDVGLFNHDSVAANVIRTLACRDWTAPELRILAELIESDRSTS